MVSAVAYSQAIADSNWELLLETNAEEIMHMHHELNSLFWHNGQLDPDVRVRLLRIGTFYFNKLSEDMPGVTLDDIVFIGSMADFLYTSHSDLDINLLVNASHVNWPVKAVASYLKQSNKYWHTRNITLSNYPIELGAYTEISTLGGIYSILKQNWLKMPEHHTISFSKDQLKEAVQQYHQEIMALQTEYIEHPAHFECNQFTRLHSALIKWRKDGLQREGLTSIENIGYRLMRALGEIDLVSDLAAECLSA